MILSPKPHKFSSLDEMFPTLVPDYRSRGWTPFMARFNWERRVPAFMEKVSSTRCEKRRQSYLIPGELERSKESIRFGYKKEGHGYVKERGDFCLVGGTLKNGHLQVFYRRLELIGGLHYDLAIFREIERRKGRIKTVTIFAANACVFALKGNSNEKLYQQLMEYYTR